MCSSVEKKGCATAFRKTNSGSTAFCFCCFDPRGGFLWKIYAALMQKRLSEIKLTKGGMNEGNTVQMEPRSKSHFSELSTLILFHAPAEKPSDQRGVEFGVNTNKHQSSHDYTKEKNCSAKRAEVASRTHHTHQQQQQAKIV